MSAKTTLIKVICVAYVTYCNLQCGIITDKSGPLIHEKETNFICIVSYDLNKNDWAYLNQSLLHK